MSGFVRTSKTVVSQYQQHTIEHVVWSGGLRGFMLVHPDRTPSDPKWYEGKIIK